MNASARRDALLGSTLPAFADDWREHREHEWREHHEYRPDDYASPVVVPPPAYSFYAPPEYAPPGVSFGINVR
jgi:hypothetical protein